MNRQFCILILLWLSVAWLAAGAAQTDVLPTVTPGKVIVEAVGSLQANRSVTLSADIGGTVVAVDGDLGQAVASGARLVQLDDTDFALAVEAARANLQLAQAQLSADRSRFERLRRLLAKKLASPSDFDEAQRAFETANAQVSVARVTLRQAEVMRDKTTRTAPFAGFISRRQIEPGQIVQPNEPLLDLVDIATVKVHFEVIERDYVQLALDLATVVVVDILPEQRFTGRITRLGVAADAATGTYSVEVHLDNPDGLLKPGFTARVQVLED